MPRPQPIVSGPGLPPAANHFSASLLPAASFVPAGPVSATGLRPSLRLPPAPTRPVYACAGSARGPPGLAVRGHACAVAHSVSSSPKCSVVPRQSALGGGLWLEAGAGHGGARDLGRDPDLAPPFLPRPLGGAAYTAGFPLIHSFQIQPPANSWPTLGCIL